MERLIDAQDPCHVADELDLAYAARPKVQTPVGGQWLIENLHCQGTTNAVVTDDDNRAITVLLEQISQRIANPGD
jgi:hypothetical protein